MIERKQPVTKQFLLSFKSGHGDFYQKFVSILRQKVHYCRQVKQHPSCPPYMLTEKCLFMAILQKKHKKFKNGDLQITQLADILKKCRTKILNSISTQKKGILKNVKDFKIQQMQNTVLQLVTRDTFAFNSFEIVENCYVYQLFKAIFTRSEELSMFGEPKYQPMTYTYGQVKQLSALFGENIVYFDYNNSKIAPAQIKFSHQTTYVLKVKEKYAILYVKQPKQIQIVKEGNITITEVQELFVNQLHSSQNKQTSQESGFFDRLLGTKTSDTQKLRQSNKLFPDQIQCAKCSSKLSEFDCLKWNYQYFCGNCLQNPRLDTSSIPSTLIEKYFNQRGMKYDDYEITCGECSGQTFLRRYNPGYKPQKYKCQVCEHVICLQHGMNIYQCFCECRECRQSTISIQHLNISACDRCKRKYCHKCNKISEKYCGCICKLCQQLIEEQHICRQRCHMCHNHINNMKICVCGGKICYGCYYYKMKNNVDKTGKMQCIGTQQIN